ncbi:MAG TPA: glycoside hydrolase family 27 protein [Bacteroidota bacterium]|nr:glycoside hydrolase family 27 protein [Bacteroidota bacterium]
MKFKRLAVLISALIIVQGPLCAQKFEGLALTPPMGWNSWNKFGCNVDEQMIRGIADAMSQPGGMKQAGYQYLVIDDCWHGGRDSAGFIYPNAERFPSGMKALADYIHSKGLKFGIYSCAGNKTCGGHPGSRGYEYQDALVYARWGVDYVKYDWCNTAGLSSVGAYTTMRDALHAAGRPVVFSLCEWGDTKPWEWGKDVGHLWRTTGDIANLFDGEVKHDTWSSWGVMKIVEMRKDIRKYAGPGHWNDPDMLEVGNGMPVNEDRAHFSLWCMMAAPLIAGNDIRSMSAETRDILTNAEVIAIDQDSLGIQGFMSERRDSIECWVKPLDGADWAVCFLNRSTQPKTLDVDWAKILVTDDLSKRTLDPTATTYRLRDLWAKRDLGTTQKKISHSLPSHDVLMVRLSAHAQ